MDQHQVRTSTPLARRLLRLLVLAGAAVVWWLLLSGGAAQADDGAGSPEVAPSAVSETSPVRSGVAHETAALATAPLRELPQRTMQVVDRATAQAPQPVQDTVQHVTTTLEPTLSATTTDLADAVDETATRLDTTVVDPVLQVAGLAPAAARVAPAAAAPAQVPALATHRDRVRTSHRQPAADAQPAFQHVSSHLSSTVGSDLGGNELPSLPEGPATPGAPSSAPSVGAAAAVLTGLVVLAPALLRLRGRRAGDAVPAGPAYLPGSSPD